MGQMACERASSDPVEEGQVGAGAGATVGKILGPAFASPGGVGTASIKLPVGVTVGALVVVNAFGDIIDSETGRILSGARARGGRGWLDTSRALAHRSNDAPAPFSAIENTTLAVVATDGALTKAEAQRVALMAHDGLARAIRPVHTMFDGDTVFALSTGNLQADVTTVGSVAADLVARAIARVCRRFES
jgi:L-aminopeptidase/D-esterase-like protein